MKLSIVFIMIVLLGAAFADKVLEEKFLMFAKKHNKQYESPEEIRMRLDIFKNNLLTIEAHNKKGLPFTLGINQFADMTNEEYQMRVLGTRFNVAEIEEKIERRAAFPALKLPEHVDWREKKAVTHVKNQGQCGSCWSFSTTGSTEGAFALATGKLLSFSEQQLMDCSTAEGNMGCNGGLMTDAFDYIIKAGGLELEAAYSYKAVQGKCMAEKTLFKGDVTGYKNIVQGSEKDLQVASANIGPVSVAIDASHTSFQLYAGGVYYEPQCSSSQLDHGVLVVGYGVEKGKDYWLVKNSWGATWGLNGYLKMSRNRNNNCGIATMASYPTGAKLPAAKFEEFLKLEDAELKVFNPIA